MGTDISMETIPLDVINAIIPFVDFRDYPTLRLVSRLLLRLLDTTDCGRHYRRLLALEKQAMSMIYNQYRQYPRMSLPMGVVLHELEKPKCECGRDAWLVYCFTFPPRKVCFWAESHFKQCKCFPRLVVSTPRLYEIFKIDENALQHLPIARPLPLPNPIVLLDLKTIEGIARRTQSKKDVDAATAKLLEDPLASFRNDGWELSFKRPIRMGILPPGNDWERNSSTISPLKCLICASQNMSRPQEHHVYETVAHDYEYLRKHVLENHSEILEDYTKGWLALPPEIRDSWSTEGKMILTTLLNTLHVPNWSGWADTVRTMWNRRIQTMLLELVHYRADWKVVHGELRGYSLPDIRSPRTVAGNDGSDMSTLLDAYFMMKEWTALREWEARWKDESTRAELCREIAGFWGYHEVYQRPPEVRYEAMGREGWFTTTG